MNLFFNEFDPFAAAWLRQLMAEGHLPHGVVDARSIADIPSAEVVEYRRAHWFAGIAGWELALQLAGWPVDRPVWTGSAPCQPYSSAGKRKGNADERDLWPVFANLVRECRPATVFGEQVASAIRFGWIDRVRADLEAEGYAVGFAVLGAHSVGAPHQRQRLYWCATRPVALSDRERHDRRRDSAFTGEPQVPQQVEAGGGNSCGVADCESGRREQVSAVCGGRSEGSGTEGRERLGNGGGTRRMGDTDEGRRAEGDAVPRRAATGVGVPVPTARGVAYADGGLAGHGGVQPGGEHGQQPEDGGAARGVGDADDEREGSAEQHGTGIGNAGGASGIARGLEHPASNGREQGRAEPDGRGAAGGCLAVWDHWRDAVGIDCRDGKRRRVPAQPGVLGVVDGLPADLGRGGVPCAARYPLAGKSPNRAARLRGYGNAICVQTAAAFVRAFLEAEAEQRNEGSLARAA